MLRKGLILLIIMSSLFLVNSEGDIYSSGSKEKGEGKTGNRLLISHGEIFGKLERPPVLFDHGLHSLKFRTEGCKTCHPVSVEGNFVFDLPFKTVGNDKQSVRDAFHGRCLSCHTKIMEEGKKSGPIRCGDCHRKEFEATGVKYPVFEFDFSLHANHVKKLKKRCILCHHNYDEELVYEEGGEQSCYYCHADQKSRGPSLSVETDLTLKKGLSIKKVSHSRCVNCHLDFSARGEKAGPIECSKCHTGKYKTVLELADIPRPERDQPKKPFILIDDAQMKGVPFDHAFHERNTKTCKACHHETLDACKKCHGMKGRPEGKGITAVNAYHDGFSNVACNGCHNIKKSEQKCAGCHYHLANMDLQAKGPKTKVCAVCHNGRKEGPGQARLIALAELNPRSVPERVTIKVLEREYDPAAFPHLKIIRRLADISNNSKAAAAFHRDVRTICVGCHHRSDAEAEAVKNKPPHCGNCHSQSFDSKNMNRPRLLAVYHRQCMGCHEKMKIKATGCADCHKEKTANARIVQSGG